MYMMAYIRLSNGGKALIDDEDFDYINQWRWQLSEQGYAVRSKYIKSIRVATKRGWKSINKLIFMHREINKTPDNLYTDHINRDKLDNRKANLRSCTYSQNLINKPLKKDGVQYRHDRPKSPWRVYVSHNKKEIYVGCFPDYEDAKNIRAAVNEQLNGEFAIW